MRVKKTSCRIKTRQQKTTNKQNVTSINFLFAPLMAYQFERTRNVNEG